MTKKLPKCRDRCECSATCEVCKHPYRPPEANATKTMCSRLLRRGQCPRGIEGWPRATDRGLGEETSHAIADDPGRSG